MHVIRNITGIFIFISSVNCIVVILLFKNMGKNGTCGTFQVEVLTSQDNTDRLLDTLSVVVFQLVSHLVNHVTS